MISFLLCLALLIGGYLVYGKVVENTFGPDDRETPAVKINDGVDYVVLPEWKLFMIQLLNIAGLGPIFGALQGALWGPIVFLWITFGTIFAGAVHDYFSGMMSERNEGASISEIAGIYLGGAMKNVMRVFSVVLLVMVGTVFAVGPAGLIVTLFKQGGHTGIVATTLFWLIIVLLYYFIATFLSIDKIIGKIYPLFGICLIVMAVGVAHRHFCQPRLHHSRDLEPLRFHASLRHTDLELHVHHRRLRRDLRLPCHAEPPDGTLHEEREAGPLRLLWRDGLRGHHCPDLGRCRLLPV